MLLGSTPASPNGPSRVKVVKKTKNFEMFEIKGEKLIKWEDSCGGLLGTVTWEEMSLSHTRAELDLKRSHDN